MNVAKNQIMHEHVTYYFILLFVSVNDFWFVQRRKKRAVTCKLNLKLFSKVEIQKISKPRSNNSNAYELWDKIL